MEAVKTAAPLRRDCQLQNAFVDFEIGLERANTVRLSLSHDSSCRGGEWHVSALLRCS